MKARNAFKCARISKISKSCKSACVMNYSNEIQYLPPIAYRNSQWTAYKCAKIFRRGLGSRQHCKLILAWLIKWDEKRPFNCYNLRFPWFSWTPSFRRALFRAIFVSQIYNSFLYSVGHHSNVSTSIFSWVVRRFSSRATGHIFFLKTGCPNAL